MNGRHISLSGCNVSLGQFFGGTKQGEACGKDKDVRKVMCSKHS